MHFWIDKRASYSIGPSHSRSMAGFSYHQQRRMKPKPLPMLMLRPHPPPPLAAPSTSQQHFKTHHLHRSRHAEFEHRSRMQPQNSQSSSPPVNVQHQIPEIRLISPRDELPATVISTDGAQRDSFRYWPIFLKNGLKALFLLTTQLAFAHYIHYELTYFHIALFVLLSVFFFLGSITFSAIEIHQRHRNSSTANPITLRSPSSDTIEPPPPYAVAIHLPEKVSSYKVRESPPPSYEKINEI